MKVLNGAGGSVVGSHARVPGSIPGQHIFFEIFFLLISDVHRKLTNTHLEMESGPKQSLGPLKISQARYEWTHILNLV